MWGAGLEANSGLGSWGPQSPEPNPGEALSKSEYFRHAGKRHEALYLLGQAFSRADHEIARGGKPSGNAIESLSLLARGEIGEGDVAAENEVEASVRRSRTQILKQKAHAFAVALPHAEEIAARLEALADKGLRQLAQRASGIAAFSRALQHG